MWSNAGFLLNSITDASQLVTASVVDVAGRPRQGDRLSAITTMPSLSGTYTNLQILEGNEQLLDPDDMSDRLFPLRFDLFHMSLFS